MPASQIAYNSSPIPEGFFSLTAMPKSCIHPAASEAEKAAVSAAAASVPDGDTLRNAVSYEKAYEKRTDRSGRKGTASRPSRRNHR